MAVGPKKWHRAPAQTPHNFIFHDKIERPCTVNSNSTVEGGKVNGKSEQKGYYDNSGYEQKPKTSGWNEQGMSDKSTCEGKSKIVTTRRRNACVGTAARRAT